MIDRDCKTCIHKHPDGCDSWECNYEKRPPRLIDAEALKASLPEPKDSAERAIKNILFDLIDSAPTVELTEEQAIDKLHETGWLPRHDKEMTERPQGKWDYEQVAFYGVCSNCGVAVASNLADIFFYDEIGKCPYNMNFCPNCGVKMKGDGDDATD